jgi:hypothetical protein
MIRATAISAFPAAGSRRKLVIEPVATLAPLDPSKLDWPAEGAARVGDETNRLFTDYSRATWKHVDDGLSIEYEAIASSLITAPPHDAFWNRLSDLKDDDEYLERFGLIDPCVLSATLALNAARCPSSTSCSGHGRDVAFVMFWLRPYKVQLICDAADAAEVSVTNGDDGDAIVFSDEIFGLFRFALELRRRSTAFRGVRGLKRSSRRSPEGRRTRQQLTMEVLFEATREIGSEHARTI